MGNKLETPSPITTDSECSQIQVFKTENMPPVRKHDHKKGGTYFVQPAKKEQKKNKVARPKSSKTIPKIFRQRLC